MELITGVVTKRNLQNIVQNLLNHVTTAEGHYRDELVNKIVYICSRDKYFYLTDFAWYITVLVDLAYTKGSTHGELLAQQIIDVTLRVPVVRPFACKQMVNVLSDIANLSTSNGPKARVFYAAAWVVGEYSDNVEDPVALIMLLLDANPSDLLPQVKSVFLQAVFKLVAFVVGAKTNASSSKRKEKKEGNLVGMDNDDAEEEEEDDGDENNLEDGYIDNVDVEALISACVVRLSKWHNCEHVEVQERVFTLEKFLRMLSSDNVEKHADLIAALSTLGRKKLTAVAAKAQKKVKVPEGLDIDEWINPDIVDFFDDNYSSVSPDRWHHQLRFTSGSQYTPYDSSNDDSSEEVSDGELAFFVQWRM